MCVQDAFGNRAGLEQGKAEQNRVADDAPDGADGIGCKGHSLDEHRIDAHTNHNQEPLQTQGQQAAQIVLPDLSLFPAPEGGKRDGGQADGK